MSPKLALVCCSLSLLVSCRSEGGNKASPRSSASGPSVRPNEQPPALTPSAKPRAELPALKLDLHLVAKSSKLLTLDTLENGALVYPSVDVPRDAWFIGHGQIQALHDAFAGASLPKDWSFGPVEGHWPDFVLLTTALRGYRGFAREANVLRKSKHGFAPSPGPLAQWARFAPLRPIRGKRLIVVETEAGARIVDANGNAATQALETRVDGARFTFTGAAADTSGQIFVSGFIPEPAPARPRLQLAGGGVSGGIAIVQRFAPGATHPAIERMPPGRAALVDELSGSGVFSAGNVTFALFGKSHTLGRFESAHWSVEELPIDSRCSGVRDFTVAEDGSVWFGTTDDPSGENFFVRRAPDGRYARVPLPPDISVWGLYAESSALLWLVASSDKSTPPSGMLYYSKPLGNVTSLD